MRTIFSRADHVHIWLGPGSNDTDKAMDFASRVGPRALAVGVLDLWSNWQLYKQVTDYLKALASSCEVGVQDRNDESSIAARELADFIFDFLHDPDLQKGAMLETRSPKNAYENLKENSLAKGITDLMQREYWHRIWIIQEISLAHEATILCGEKAIPIEIFDATFSAVSLCINLSFHSIFPWARNFSYLLPANFYESIALTTRRIHRRQDRSEMIKLSGVLFRFGLPPGRPHYSATDDRDILFGLLGIVTDGEALGLRVDYNMTVAEVFTATTRALICDENKGSGPLVYQLDQCVPRQRGDPPFDSLPSWVPEWQVIGKRGVQVNPINYFGAFNATAGMSPPRPRNGGEDDSRGILRYPGCRVDVITAVMQPPQWEQHDEWTLSWIVDAEGWLDSICDFAKLAPESGPGEDYVWRTIMRDFSGISHRPSRFNTISEEEASITRKIMRRAPIALEALTSTERDYVHYLRDILDYPTYEQLNSETINELEYILKKWPQAIGSINRGRTLFKTTNAMFGLGHVAIRPGDVVTLLWGLRSPIILRPRDYRDGGGFTFVGDAYVDGIMYGEFLETAPAHEDFEIY